ncbi:SCO0930 family lipoprotein [Streptomyces hainanensis]|uniref:Lipoprotein n=1 Tax=Streptomyces hainanensis TaxID=402648 RepID=A0A4R4T3M6_9ACTN|nr:SCO0930 family lipoprotein [Streptomyces hainanensis]TDC71410.1 hypothetical protein E1283_23590 [Streptomyces hainanensis]
MTTQLTRQRFPHRSALTVAAVASLFLTVACGGADDGGTTTIENAGASSDSGYDYGDGYGDDSGASPQLGEPAGELAVAEDSELGEVVTDAEGFTLYRFENDTADPPVSNCEGDCLVAWPAVPADDAAAAAGIDASLLGEVERSDGSLQLTLNGWPVYRYAEDAAPGDVNGHGVGGVWNALAPSGAPAGSGAAEGGGGAEAGGEFDELNIIDDPDLGEIVADSEGRTLYRFDNDTAWPMSTGCLDACLETWKPAEFIDPAVAEQLGFDPELIIPFERPDGTTQLTIDCWPVYYFTGDQEPGDTTGHGAQDLWWAVTPEGGKAGGA